jgi:ribose transport system permease protein
MVRLLGLALLVAILYGILYSMVGDTAFRTGLTLQHAFFAILTLGAAMVILTGGIDLSMGSVVALSAVLFAQLMRYGLPYWVRREHGQWEVVTTLCPPLAALGLVILLGALIGLGHGLMITKLRLQPFLVTLCGLFIYRGLAQFAADGRNVGWSSSTNAYRDNAAFWQQKQWLDEVINESFRSFPYLLGVTLVLATLIALLLHGTVWGRYLFALGANEQAVRYAGIPTDRYKILAYVICSALAALSGAMELIRESTASPASAGNLYELYAITGAVLGGCSLRGGQGNVLGILLGATILPLLMEITTQSEQVSDHLKYTVVGLAMLVGTIGDELIQRRTRRR